MSTKAKQCRICFQKNIKPFLDLGPMPLPNGFLNDDQVLQTETSHPLSVGFCSDCTLVQIVDVVNPATMFSNYLYIPSSSQTRLDNFHEIVRECLTISPPMKNSLAVDIGSNDGSLLLEFKHQGINTLGIDPAENLAKLANLKGINTINDFFSNKLSKVISNKYRLAQYITATNVVAHINDLHDFFKGVRSLLQKNGVFMCEFPYLVDLLEKNLFDTIYQEHLSYLAVRPLILTLNDSNLKIVSLRRTPIDGGALRIGIARNDSTLPESASAINKLLSLEKQLKLNRITTYRDFSRNVRKLRKKIVHTVRALNNKGNSIAGYGASARGNILLNYCGIDKNSLDFIVDSTPYKQGLFTPGTHIKIFPEAEILNRMPDYVLILAWNFAHEIIKKQKTYQRRGGKFIIPVPNVKIV